jgi:hypothetical protein
MEKADEDNGKIRSCFCTNTPQEQAIKKPN